jgi:hypothetical protein
MLAIRIARCTARPSYLRRLEGLLSHPSTAPVSMPAFTCRLWLPWGDEGSPATKYCSPMSSLVPVSGKLQQHGRFDLGE